MKVRDVIKMIEQDGWYPVVIKGSHRQYKHRVKSGRVTIAGHTGDDLAPGTFKEPLINSTEVVILSAAKNPLLV